MVEQQLAVGLVRDNTSHPEKSFLVGVPHRRVARDAAWKRKFETDPGGWTLLWTDMCGVDLKKIIVKHKFVRKYTQTQTHTRLR